MHIKEIQQAITKLSPDELAQLREWLREYEGKVKAGAFEDSNESIEDTLKRLRGSLRGKGVLKTLMDERRMEGERGK
jgi:hypothetical protein